MATTEPPIEDLAKDWLRVDHDPDTRQEIEQLLFEKNHEELEARLRTRIAFGTAGLRAKMEAGFSRMNCLTVIQASQGLAEYVIEQVPDAKRHGVVIGYDARRNSKKFAKLTAAAFVTKNFKVWWYEVPVHTPLVPFGVRQFGASAGVMITASHNPPNDNGYKVYWGNGCQIIPPHDHGIAQSILQNLEPLSWDKHLHEESLLVEGCLAPIMEKYKTAVNMAADTYSFVSKHPQNHVDFAYTAMHGVGLRYMTEAVNAIGLEKSYKVVQEQAHPDPNFPGLPFPNPEEKGALDVSIWSADRHGASLILATDPDADRLAVAEKVDGQWHQFSGNQLGILLAAFIITTYTGDKKKLAMIASTVSSRMLAIMAEKEGFHFDETLTGFKWMGNKALELDAEGYDTRYAFEESIGYMIPGVVKDKDGVAAAMTFLHAVVYWQNQKQTTPWHKLQALYKRYGYFEESNTYYISPSPTVTKEVFDNIRKFGKPFPQTLGPRKVLKWRDLTLGWDSSTPDHKPTLPTDETSQMITCELEGGTRLTTRASGTEPKIKIYIECHSSHQPAARKGADEVLHDVVLHWLNPEAHGLKSA
ncbi:phosphoglucomutase-like protein [Microthyrium microscopicum]|uniref:Phosphoglucomutase-like protein n=1 Tax=Microthyrium microscopicum TaxID=703497 RepID=A0A6A6UGG7_9PEZI|nr:phosphoglucomutase-like protein [Microthyrium microscopicum]